MAGSVQPGDEMKRVRLSEWARMQGISRITAYRMLRRGILSVPSERSPTGRWYVLLPPARSGNTAIYARSAPGPHHVQVINDQIAVMSAWAAEHNRIVFTIVREVADPLVVPLPKLERLLADSKITEIIVESPRIIGSRQIALLLAALAPQGRSIISVR